MLLQVIVSLYVILGLSAYGLRVRSQNGPTCRHSLSSLSYSAVANLHDHPHLFSKQGQPYSPTNASLANIDRNRDAAVVFHGFGRAGKRLLLSKLCNDRTPAVDLNTVSVFPLMRFQNGKSSLHVINAPNVDSQTDNLPQLLDNEISEIQLQLDSLHLAPNRIYVVTDLNAFDASSAPSLILYLEELARRYASQTITVVFNKADAVPGPDQIERQALFQRLVLPSSIGFVTVSARDCIGQLNDDLNDALLCADQSRDVTAVAVRDTILTPLTSFADLADSMMKSAQSQITKINPVPNFSPCYRISPIADLRDRQHRLEGLRWVSNWIQNDAKRYHLADRIQEFDPNFNDSKSNYDSYRAFWTLKYDIIQRSLKRNQIEEQMQAQLNEFTALSGKLHADLTLQLDLINQGKRARQQIMNRFAPMSSAN